MSDISSDILALNILVTAIGKALVKKGILTNQEVIFELNDFIRPLTSRGDAHSKLIVAEIKNLTKSVKDWQ